MLRAIQYAELLGVPFSFASSGEGFVFRDTTLSDGVLERHFTHTEFPSSDELCADLRQRLAERGAVQARLAEALVETACFSSGPF